jgi:transcriptional repressor NF-X1
MNLSCGDECRGKLGCGNHSCMSVCHEGDCAPCEVVEEAMCYCGKVRKGVECGSGIEEESVLEGEERWVGRFECENECGRRVSSQI